MVWGRDLAAGLRELALKAASLGLERGSRLVVTLASAPILGEVAFGRLVYASTVTAVLALTADLGLGAWSTRALARNPSAARDIVAVGLRLRGLAVLPYFAAVLAVAWLGPGGEARVAVLVLGVAAALHSGAEHFGAVFRGSGRFADETRLNLTRAGLTLAAGASGLALVGSLSALCVALLIASAGAFLHGLAMVLRMHPPPSTGGRAPRTFDAMRAALRESVPIWLAGVLSLLYFKVDTFFLHSLSGDAELGAYGAAYKLFEGAMLLPAVVLAVAFPRLSRLHGDASRQRGLERRVGLGLLGAGVVTGGVYYFARSLLIGLLFGAGFARAEASLRVLALGVPLVYVNFALTHFLIARDRERVNTWLALMMLVVTLVLDAALIPRFAGPGAAWATIVAEIALTSCCFAALLPRRARAPLTT